MKKLLIATSVAGFLSSAVSIADENSQQDISELKTMIQQMRQDYEKRISELESRLAEAEQQKQTEVATADTESSNRSQDNAFNPAISLILEGKYASYKNDPESYELPGFALGGEAELKLGLHRNFPRLSQFPFGDGDLQHTIFATRRDFLRIDRIGQTKATIEAAISPFNALIILALVLTD